MSKLTQKLAVQACRMMWRKMSKVKYETAGKWDAKDRVAKEVAKELGLKLPENSCFLCEYNKTHSNLSYCNSNCLLNWGQNGDCVSSSSYYDKWSNEPDPDEIRALALKISKLPVRKGVRE